MSAVAAENPDNWGPFWDFITRVACVLMIPVAGFIYKLRRDIDELKTQMATRDGLDHDMRELTQAVTKLTERSEHQGKHLGAQDMKLDEIAKNSAALNMQMVEVVSNMRHGEKQFVELQKSIDGIRDDLKDRS